MKNNFLVIFLVCLFFNNFSVANEFRFETGQIDILDDGNLIVATDGKAVSLDELIEIKAQKFNYNKNLRLLEAVNG